MHSIIYNMFSANTVVLIVLFGINLLANNVSCIKCYVCGVSNCSDFNISNENLYVKQCPPKYVGCVTHKTGNSITSRACEEYNHTVCRTLNTIEYCFCGGNLCNGIDRYVPESDDEDLTEGSGTESSKQLDPVIEIMKPKANGATVMKSVAVLVCNFMWLI